MKLSVIGTHSAGKTTLAEKISEEFKIPYKRGDKTQEIFKKLGFKKEVDQLDNDEQWKLQKEILSSLDELQSSEGPHVTDGSSLTCIPYGLLFSNHGIIDRDGFQDFIRKAKNSARQTDLLLYLPPEIALENDGFRPEDNQIRMDIDNFIHGLLKEGEFNFRTITGTVAQRLQQVGKILGKREPDFMDRYVAFEGMPRAGKSTQLNIIEGEEVNGHRIYKMKRLKSPAMKDFKTIRKERPYDNSDETVELACASLKYDFDNNQVYERLEDGQIVIADRHKFSFITLFGALGVPAHKIYSKTYEVPAPGQVYLFDIDPNTTVKRAIETGESALKRDITFQRGIRDRYHDLAKEYGFETVNANQSIDGVTNELMAKLRRGVPNGRQ